MRILYRRPSVVRLIRGSAVLLIAVAVAFIAASCNGSGDTPTPTGPTSNGPTSIGQQAPTVPLTYNGRCVDVQGTVTVQSRSVTFFVWDDATIDGDVISLIVNGSVVLAQATLDGPFNKRSVSATLSNDGYNYIILFAHNEGSIPPNTAALSITDGASTQNLIMSANLSTNGAYNVVVGSAPAAPPRAPCASSPTAPPPSTSTVTMRFTLNDSCGDGLGLQARFFDKTNNLVWPADSSKVYVASSGGAIDVSLAARAGASVCYGAQPDPPNNRYWGVGISGTNSCSDCCYTASSDQTVRRNLVCQ
jgi:hypothetical protein